MSKLTKKSIETKNVEVIKYGIYTYEKKSFSNKDNKVYVCEKVILFCSQ